jgi:acyl CoA:acetate/3-ketoacid CoA transferase beta subunit
MEHVAKDGSPKILENCTLPLTAAGKVHHVVTEHAFFSIVNRQLVLDEIAAELSVEQLRSITGAAFLVSPQLKTLQRPQ